MSVFTNPASSASEHAAAYVAAVLDLLGDRDPFEVLRSTLEIIRRHVRNIAAGDITKREAPGKWSVGEVIQHLADSELVGAYRFRMILAHDRPQLTSYDQDLWADRLQYREADHEEALALLSALRRANLKLFTSASEADMQRVGIHAERGANTLEEMMRLYAGHDLVHLRQIERIRRSLE